jgi:hypothetical protein
MIEVCIKTNLEWISESKNLRENSHKHSIRLTGGLLLELYELMIMMICQAAKHVLTADPDRIQKKRNIGCLMHSLGLKFLED